MMGAYTKSATDPVVPANILKGWEGNPFVSEAVTGEVPKDNLIAYENKNETKIVFSQMTDGANVVFDGDKMESIALVLN